MTASKSGSATRRDERLFVAGFGKQPYVRITFSAVAVIHSTSSVALSSSTGCWISTCSVAPATSTCVTLALVAADAVSASRKNGVHNHLLINVNHLANTGIPNVGRNIASFELSEQHVNGDTIRVEAIHGHSAELFVSQVHGITGLKCDDLSPASSGDVFANLDSGVKRLQRISAVWSDCDYASATRSPALVRGCCMMKPFDSRWSRIIRTSCSSVIWSVCR